MFKRGDRVRYNARGREYTKHPFRAGTYSSSGRFGDVDIVLWDGNKKRAVINQGFLELLPAADAVDPHATSTGTPSTRERMPDDF